MRIHSRCLRSQTGLSLVELVIAVGIITMIIGALYSLLISGYKQYDYGNKRIEEYQYARSGMMRMIREIRYSTQIVNSGSYLTDNYRISIYGIPISNKQLTTSDRQLYSGGDAPWLESAGVIVIVNGTVILDNYLINYTNGTVMFTSAQPIGTVVKADYTRDAYMTFYLDTSTRELRRTVNGVYADTVAKYVVNNQLSTPIFTWSAANSDIVTVNLIIDRDINKEPRAFTLKSDIRLRI